MNLLRKLAFPATLKAILTLLFPKGQTAWERSVLHPKEQSVVLVQRASVSPAESGGLSETSPSLNLLCATRAGDKQLPTAPKLPILPSVLLNKDHFFKRRRNLKKKKSTQAATFHIPVTEPSPSSDTRREPRHRATSAPSSPLDRGSAREERPWPGLSTGSS